MIKEGDSKHILLKQIKKVFNRHPEAFPECHTMASDIVSAIVAT